MYRDASKYTVWPHVSNTWARRAVDTRAFNIGGIGVILARCEGQKNGGEERHNTWLNGAIHDITYRLWGYRALNRGGGSAHDPSRTAHCVRQ